MASFGEPSYTVAENLFRELEQQADTRGFMDTIDIIDIPPPPTGMTGSYEETVSTLLSQAPSGSYTSGSPLLAAIARKYAGHAHSCDAEELFESLYETEPESGADEREMMLLAHAMAPVIEVHPHRTYDASYYHDLTYQGMMQQISRLRKKRVTIDESVLESLVR